MDEPLFLNQYQADQAFHAETLGPKPSFVLDPVCDWVIWPLLARLPPGTSVTLCEIRSCFHLQYV